MEKILALQNAQLVEDPLDDEMCWSTCSSSGCTTSSVFVADMNTDFGCLEDK